MSNFRQACGRIVSFWGGWSGLLAVAGVLGFTTPAPLSAQLPRKAVKAIDSLLTAAPFERSLWGIALLDEKGRLLYGHNADKLFIPASNTKLVVSAAAAAMLPADWTIRTSLYGTGPIKDGVLEGNLVLYGRGDPTMGRRCYATDTTRSGVCDRDPFTRLRELATGLRAAGVTIVRGDLIGDGSWFDPELIHSDWVGYDLNWWYAAPVTGLGFNDNSVDISWKPGPTLGSPAVLTMDPNLGDVTLENRTRTTIANGPSNIGDRMYRVPGTLQLWAEGEVAADYRGSVESFALPDPNLFAARALRQALAEAGIAVLGTAKSTTDSTAFFTARGTTPLAETVSRPLTDWIFPVLNTSQNWYAEMLLKQLGRQFDHDGSWEGGLAVERRFLRDSVRADTTQFALADGSGLSASNLVSPLTFAQLLGYIRKHARYESFAAGLPQSGQTGSLKNRFLGTPMEGRVRAKTGSISRVNTLSGYLELPNGKSYSFSVQLNHHAAGGRRALNRIDDIVLALARAVGSK
jgi:D-alanyl-D-alanine carboxypeptidase/D-alanyl-D-alanine-endopeptidase (penicillin-binding protein 4)